MEENTWNEKFETDAASQVIGQWKPTDYDIRIQSLSYAGNFIQENEPRKLETFLKAAKEIENYLKKGDIKVVYEKGAL